MIKIEGNMKRKRNVFSITEIIIMVIVTSLVSALSAGLIITNNFRNNSGISYLNLVNDQYLKEFLNVYGSILSGYYEDVDPEAAINSAIDGLTTYLGDRYTTYMSEDEATALENTLKGTYEGYGISMSVDNPQIVHEVYDNTPASKVGILKDDKITKINGVDVTGLTTTEITNMIKENSSVNLEIERNGNIINFTLNAEIITLPQVTYDVVENNGHKIGYLYIETFSATIANQVENALKKLESENIESLILDVRYNGGGYLAEATKIINMFLEKGKVIYSLESKDGTETHYDETDEKRTYPIIILQNGASASASEILTAALVDSYGAKTLGTTSYGKGKVQKKIDLDDGSSLKYTTSKWLRPNGECIDNYGINPYYLVELEYIKDSEGKVVSVIDTQLTKAIEILSN